MLSTAIESPSDQEKSFAGMQIPPGEIIFEFNSGQDEVGQVFRWRDEIYRGIPREYAPFYKRLLSSPVFKQLNDLGVVETEITPYRADGYDLVLKPKTIPVVSYPTEWTPAMFRDAALVNCDIQLCLLESGYTLKDGHAWNTLFDGWRPIFVDLGSICEKRSRPPQNFASAFRRVFFNPLLLLHSDASPLARAAMNTYLGVPSVPIFRLLFLLMPMRRWLFHLLMDRMARPVSRRSPKAAVKWLRRQIEQLPAPAAAVAPKRPSTESVSERESGSRKALAVDEILDKLKPESVLQIGLDEWWDPSRAARAGIRITVADSNESGLNQLYYQAKSERLNLLVLQVDPIVSSPPHDLWGFHRPLPERLRSDLVIMFETTSYLTGKIRRPFADLARRLCSFAGKAAVVEIARQSSAADEAPPLEGFREVLARYFSQVCVYRQLDHERWLLLCLGPRPGTAQL